MKKTLLSIAIVLSAAGSAYAQNVDWDFETWVNVTATPYTENPIGWTSCNILAIASMPATVIKESTAPYKGKAAAKIITQVLPTGLKLPGVPDTVGLLVTGTVDIFSQKIQMGTPYTGRPAKASFAYKYEPNGADSATVLAFLTKWNASKGIQDTIASGNWGTSIAATAWDIKEFDLHYNPDFDNVLPDSIIFIAASSIGEHPKVGSTFYIDDITFSGFVSVNDLDGIKNNVNVFPVPAKENITFSSTLHASSVEVLDITGRRVGYYNMVNNKVTIETVQLQNGLYIYNVTNSENRVVGRGKFEIAK